MQIPSWIKRELEEKTSRGNYRNLKTNDFNLSSNYGSNDYLALSINSEVLSEFRNAKSVGVCASRLMGSDFGEAALLEEDLARYFEFETTLLYSSGFLANLGLVSAVVRRDDLVFSDKHIHASLNEGIRLAGAKHFRFRHSDLEHLEDFLQRESKKRKAEQHFYIVVESLYSMEGDTPDISQLSILARKYNCFLIIDESHAVGVFDHGLSSEISRENLILTATCSKAFGTYGGFVCGPKWLKELLVNSSRAFIYNTALPSAIIRATQKSLQIVRDNQSLGFELLKNAKNFRDNLNLSNNGSAQIVPIYLDSSEISLRISSDLKELGYLVPAIRPPTVKKAILRISLTLHHSKQDLVNLSSLIKSRLSS